MSVNCAGPVICRFFGHIENTFVYLWQFEKTCRWIAGLAVSKQLRKGMSWHRIYLDTSLYYHFVGDHLLHLFAFFNWNITKIKRKFFLASLMAQLVKNLPATRDLVLIPRLGISLEKGMATHSSILARRIPWTLQSMGSQRVRHDWATFTLSVSH